MVWVEMTTRRGGASSSSLVRGLFAGRQDGRHEIGEALAHAGAGLDDEMMAVRDGVGDGIGHGQLFVAMFVVRQPGGDPPRRPQDFSRREHVLSVA